MKLDKVRDFNIDCSMPQSDTFSISLRKLNGLVFECVKGSDNKAYLPANNAYLDIQRIGLNRKGKTLINRVPLAVFMQLTQMHYGTVSNGSAIGCYVPLGSLFLDEKDELQVSITYDNRADGKFYTLDSTKSKIVTTTAKPASIKMKISTLDANSTIDHSFRYDKSKDYERPVNNVEAIYIYSENLEKPVSHQDYGDMSVQFNRVVGDDILFDFSTACLSSVIFNTIEDIEEQTICQIYKNVDTIPSSGRIQLPMANDHKELTLLVVERVLNAKAMLRQTSRTLKEENERLKSLESENSEDAAVMQITGAVPTKESAERAIKEVDEVAKVVEDKAK